jgi:hypothetical protein
MADTQRKRRSGADGVMRRVVAQVRAWPAPVRIGAGILLLAGGFVGFLPVVGFWMIPAGLIVLAIDLPFLRRPVRRAQLFVARLTRRIEAQMQKLFPALRR